MRLTVVSSPRRSPRGDTSKSAAGVAVILLLLLIGANARDDAPAAEAAPAAPAAASPVPGSRITSGFGPRWGAMHYGLDFAAPQGTPIRAVAAGTVTKAEPAGGFGLWVHVRHTDGTVSVYGHMHTITTRVGARVRAGEQIATVGSRGQSTGPHLHLEIWPGGRRAERVDPRVWLAEHGALPPIGGTR